MNRTAASWSYPLAPSRSSSGRPSEAPPGAQPACAVGRTGPDGPWLGFAPTIDDGYALVVGGADDSHRAPADADVLLALTVAYFEDALDEPPDDLAATHGDIGALVRHLAAGEDAPNRRRALDEAVDAVDDGLAADVVIARLTAAMSPRAAVDPIGFLLGRARALAESA